MRPSLALTRRVGALEARTRTGHRVTPEAAHAVLVARLAELRARMARGEPPPPFAGWSTDAHRTLAERLERRLQATG